MCGKNEAIFEYRELDENNKMRVLHLCAECAAKKGLSSPLMIKKGEPVDIARCGPCGLSYEDFKKRGKFGCADCYSAFRAKLYPLLRRIHGSDHHTGKILIRDERMLTLKRNIRELRKELKKALEEEEYEKAAKIRDEISHYEEELKKL